MSKPFDDNDHRMSDQQEQEQEKRPDLEIYKVSILSLLLQGIMHSTIYLLNLTQAT